MEENTVVEASLKSSLHKLLLVLVKYIPVLIAFCYMLNTIVAYLAGTTIEPLSNIAGMSLMTWLFTYVSSWVFHFCIYHRLFLYYILVDDIVNITDYYWVIPTSTDNIIMAHAILMGMLVFIITLMHVRSNKGDTGKNSK